MLHTDTFSVSVSSTLSRQLLLGGEVSSIHEMPLVIAHGQVKTSQAIAGMEHPSWDWICFCCQSMTSPAEREKQQVD